MAGPADRRGFLRGLATLPLIGGGVTLMGQPTAAAEPLTDALLDSYDAWLYFERRLLRAERRAGLGIEPMMNAGAAFHWPQENQRPMERAAIILAAAGCDWREEAGR